MKRNDSRLILNLNVTDDELQERVHLAVEDYISKYMDTDNCRQLIDAKIETRVKDRLNEFDKDYWNPPKIFSYKGKNNLSLQYVVASLVEDAICNYLSSGVVAKQVVKKLNEWLSIEEEKSAEPGGNCE